MAHFTVKLYDAHGRMVGRREFSAADDREAEAAVGQLGEDPGTVVRRALDTDLGRP